ncbi:hypothetical protein [Planotetraspora kaengkrachanensis]|uniref:Lipoprotein n=1 Tax=Planotetraspora kaengkrachanensis TaxID=575193 RepID=A0A8J3M0S2_9ACTN|nr:hypothetical protein [Planotetraspora kaengkrachanensis]GIG80270.1 hypothetical protein Pka01_33970 [Planotetraspora kaengkrachanensis]
MRRVLRSGLALLVALLAAAGCGVPPTGVVDTGPAPIARGAASLTRIYLVRDGRLQLTSVAVGSPHVSDLMATLFRADAEPTERLNTALDGLHLAEVQLVRYVPDASSRNDPDNTVTLRMRVFVSGPRISRIAMAQITCTARLRSEVWAVEIAHGTPGDTGPLKVHTCREYWDLAPRDGHLPP